VERECAVETPLVAVFGDGDGDGEGDGELTGVGDEVATGAGETSGTLCVAASVAAAAFLVW
jgi:hypothetical protein